MKKVLTLIIAFALCISPAGCGNRAATADTQHKAVDSQSQTAESQPATAQESYASARISYLGPEGTYTQEACNKFFNMQGNLTPCETVSDAVTALVSGECDYAVIPQENTIGGPVIDYVDTVIGQTGVSVVGEVELLISQNLLVVPGTTLSDIKTVYSHKQGIAQGKEWLSENVPDAEVIEVSSTAEGAKMVSEAHDPSCAAIASAGCADVYGLEILAAGIQNNDNNKTRFYVLSMKEPGVDDGERLAFIAAGDAENLPGLMADMEELKMELVTIHDRPLKTELGEYYYLVECKGGSYESYQKLTEKSAFEFRYLGSFDVR